MPAAQSPTGAVKKIAECRLRTRPISVPSSAIRRSRLLQQSRRQILAHEIPATCPANASRPPERDLPNRMVRRVRCKCDKHPISALHQQPIVSARKMDLRFAHETRRARAPETRPAACDRPTHDRRCGPVTKRTCAVAGDSEKSLLLDRPLQRIAGFSRGDGGESAAIGAEVLPPAAAETANWQEPFAWPSAWAGRQNSAPAVGVVWPCGRRFADDFERPTEPGFDNRCPTAWACRSRVFRGWRPANLPVGLIANPF